MRVRTSWFGAALVIIAAPAIAQTLVAPTSAPPSTAATSSGAVTSTPAVASSVVPTGSPQGRATLTRGHAGAGAAPLHPSSRRSPYSDTLTKGHAAMAAGNTAAAREAYRAAVAADPRDTLALYFLGQAQATEGELSQAEASYARGLAVANGRDDVHARLLFVMADLRERQGNWAEASRAWEAYRQFATAHPDVKAYATNASERAKVVSGRADLDAKYAAVKQRIAARQKPPATPPSGGTPAAPKKK